MRAAIKWIVHFVVTDSVGHVSVLGPRNVDSTNVDTNKTNLPVILLWKQRYDKRMLRHKYNAHTKAFHLLG
jgi:hypothetical protein